MSTTTSDEMDEHVNFLHKNDQACEKVTQPQKNKDYFMCTALKYNWRYIAAVLFMFTTLFTIWRLVEHSATGQRTTDLREDVFTSDGKAFPHGYLSWEQRFAPLPCGKTPSEALAAGCHFDIVATAWLPPRCIDYELVAEFEALYDWQYFRDPNGTDPYPKENDILGSQTGTIWTTVRWHWAHCLFMWKKLNRALVQGRTADAEVIQLKHTNHCVNLILRMNNPDALGTNVEIIYPPC
ncbi:hypothetical protein ACHAQJ_010702 [Trichoderma viride]